MGNDLDSTTDAHRLHACGVHGRLGAVCAAYPLALATAPLWFFASLCVNAAMAVVGRLRKYCPIPFATAIACLVAWAPCPVPSTEGPGETFEVVTHNLSFANGRPHEEVSFNGVNAAPIANPAPIQVK